MFRRFSLTLVAVTALVASLGAQATTPAPPAPPAPPPARAVPMQNVKVEVIITDTFGGTPAKKTVSVLGLDGHTGRIRSSQNVGLTNPMNGSISYNSIGINVDATPNIRPDGRVELQLSVSYTPQLNAVEPGGNSAQKPADINESMTTLLIDGKSTLLSQSADPQSDRKVTLEVTATVVR
jgi:hypothetical protein